MTRLAIAVACGLLVAWFCVQVYLPARARHSREEIWMMTPTEPTRVLLRPGEGE